MRKSLREQMNTKIQRRLRGPYLDNIIGKMIDNMPAYTDTLLFDVIEGHYYEGLEEEERNILNYYGILINYEVETRKYIVYMHNTPEEDLVIYAIIKEIVFVIGGYKFLPLKSNLKSPLKEVLIDFAIEFGDWLKPMNPVTSNLIMGLSELHKWVLHEPLVSLSRNARYQETLLKLGEEVTEQQVKYASIWGSIPYFTILERATESLEREGYISIKDNTRNYVIKFEDGKLLFTSTMSENNENPGKKNFEAGPPRLTRKIDDKNHEEIDISKYGSVKMKLKENKNYIKSDVGWFNKLKNTLNLYKPEEFASYKTPDRRFAFYGLIVQGQVKEQKQNIEGIDFYLDTSVSMPYDTLLRAVSIAEDPAFRNLKNNYNVFGSTVIEVSKAQIRNKELNRFGSTNINPVVQKINSKGQNKLSIIVTDGEFNWDMVSEIKYDTVILHTLDENKSLYRNVHLIRMKGG